jgi:hypothetical protein
MSSTSRKALAAICASLLVLVLMVVALDVALYLLQWPHVSIHERDGLLGWRVKPALKFTRTERALDGKEYRVDYATDALGLRTFGARRDAPVRILVLGDSFTMQPTASNDRMWYARLAQDLSRRTGRPLDDFFVMAGGGGGYGTYQELLLARELVGQVRPTLLVLQFCANDFVNNHFEWEGEGIVRIQYSLRPYASLGSEEPRYHSGPGASLYRWLAHRSRIFGSIERVIEDGLARKYQGYARPLPPDQVARYQREAVEITRKLLSQLRGAFAGIPAVMVNCSGEKVGPNAGWMALGAEAGFVPLGAPSDLGFQAHAHGDRGLFLADGAHLSEEGNQAYGAALGEEMFRLGIPPVVPARE